MPNDIPPGAPAPTPAYPPGTVRALLGTDHVTPRTREVLRARLDEGGGDHTPRYFGDVEYATLRAACARLVPQPGRGAPGGDPPVDLAAAVDARLAAGDGDGWRYAAMPPDPYAYPRGLRGLDEHAHDAFGAPFAALDRARQDAVLQAVQRGAARGAAWDAVPAARFFEELLAEVAAYYYSHPLAQEEIGYVGMADVPRWSALGLDDLDEREPRPLDTPVGVPVGAPNAGDTGRRTGAARTAHA